MRLGMVIDLKRCIGCFACQIACKAEHGTRPGALWARVVKREYGTFPNVRRVSLPLLCMHCRKGPCLEVCPTGAEQAARRYRHHRRGEVRGLSLLHDGLYLRLPPLPGRRAHLLPRPGPNPYEAVAYAEHPTGVVEKCDFCVERIDRGLDPACVVNCPTKARTFGDLHDRESEITADRRAWRLSPAQNWRAAPRCSTCRRRR